MGIDLEPVAVYDLAAVRWLEACLWPEQRERVTRFRAAVELARTSPPAVVPGDMVDTLSSVVDGMPPDSHVDVFHSWALVYVERARRDDLATAIAAIASTGRRSAGHRRSIVASCRASTIRGRAPRREPTPCSAWRGGGTARRLAAGAVAGATPTWRGRVALMARSLLALADIPVTELTRVTASDAEGARRGVRHRDRARPAHPLPAALHRPDPQAPIRPTCGIGDEAMVLVTVERIVEPAHARAAGKALVTVDVTDGSGHLRVTFFNQPWRRAAAPGGHARRSSSARSTATRAAGR